MKMLRAAIAACMVLFAGNAFGMTRASAPAKFSIPFAASAGAPYITYPTPTPSQIGSQCGAASLTDGFPPLTMQSAQSGGCAPLGQNFNGILKQITQWNQQSQMGAAPQYDAGFSSSIGGYPEGSILSQAATPACFWISQVDNNATNPDTGGGGWTGTCPGGGIGGTSTDGANAQAITTTPFALLAQAKICFIAGFTNSGSTQINANGAGLVNVLTRTPQGLAALSGGEIRAGTVTCDTWDGAQWELDVSAASASLTQPDQILAGGANVTTFSLGTGSGGGTVTIDCGKGPLESVTNAGNFTFAAPANDGSCDVKVTNNNAAGTISFSGFTVNANTGEPLTTANGSVFFVHFERIAGTSTYLIKSLQ